jgi:hypothetical protein
MFRPIAIALLLSAGVGPAFAQYPGVASPVPSPYASPPQLGGAPAPPQAMPGPKVTPYGYAPPRTVRVPNGRAVLVPSGPPSQNSYSDRVERCIAAGTAAGLGPNKVGSFSRYCAN